MLIAQDLTVEIGDRTLVRDAQFRVGPRDRVGLVGRNGAGKSSLLSVMLGQAGPHVRSRGDVRVQGTVGFLPQLPSPEGLGREPNAFSHILSARHLDTLDEDLQRARQAMEADSTEAHIAHFADLEERFRLAGGYEVEGVVARLADGLGLRQELLLEDLASLSGGQRRRVDLIRVLFGDPDTMVLDEPTNHLDVSAKRWLVQELERSSKALLLVSHDIALLDHAITKVLHLAEGRVAEYAGTYTRFRTQLESDTVTRERVAGREAKEIRRLSSLADSMRSSTAGRARKAKVLDRRVARMTADRTEVRTRERSVAFRLPEPERSGATPLHALGLGVSYDGRKVLGDVEMPVDRGDRAVVIGRNGAGKSSLLRCLAGVQAPSSGEVRVDRRAVLGYFAQEHEQLDAARSALDHIDDTVLAREADRRALLGSFGLTGRAAHQRPGSLSGGERAKLALAVLAAGRANVIVLDEPTNNLDPASVDAVGRMLARWSGTIVAVSHDRAFVEALEPTHALHLPEERYTFWRDEYLDDVAVR